MGYFPLERGNTGALHQAAEVRSTNRSEWAEEGNSDNGPVFVSASPDSGGPEEVNTLCVRGSPADVCSVEEEEGAGRGQTWRRRVNNRPHCRVAAAALQTTVDAEEEREDEGVTHENDLDP